MSLTAAQNRFTGFFGVSYFYGWGYFCCGAAQTVKKP